MIQSILNQQIHLEHILLLKSNDHEHILKNVVDQQTYFLVVFYNQIQISILIPQHYQL